MAKMVKNPPAVQETRVSFLDWEEPLEKGTATYSSIFILFYLFVCFDYCGSLLCTGFSLVASSRGYSLAAGLGLLTAVASLVAEHRL